MNESIMLKCIESDSFIWGDHPPLSPVPLEYINLPSLIYLIKYRDYRIPTGDFLRCIISNDFMEAVIRADENNQKYLQEYASFMFNEMPRGSIGNNQKYKDWIRNE